MTEDKVKKAAQDMIALVEGDPWFRRANWPAGEGANILDTTQFQALKASLTPSRMFDLIIADLRKGDVK